MQNEKLGVLRVDDIEYDASLQVHAGYLVVCPDMPGFGASPGPRPGTRSELACEPGGAADVVARLIGSLGVSSAVLVGYDWGAGVALSMAASARHRRLVSAACLMHPAFAQERVKDELLGVKGVVAPTRA